MKFFSLFLFFLITCASIKKEPREGVEGANDDTQQLKALALCEDHESYRLQDGAEIRWAIERVRKDSQALDFVKGTMPVSGIWTMKSGRATDAQLTLNFDAHRIDSGNALRNDRLRSYLFLLPMKLPSYFVLEHLQGPDVLPKGESSWTAEGKLTIAGVDSGWLSIPLKLHSVEKKLLVKPAQPVKIKIGEPGTMAIDLSDNLQQLMSFASGYTVEEAVSLDFALVFENRCNN